MRYGEQLDAEPMNMRGWRAGETCNGSHHDVLALHEDRCLSSQEGESRDLRVLILMAGTVL